MGKVIWRLFFFVWVACTITLLVHTIHSWAMELNGPDLIIDNSFLGSGWAFLIWLGGTLLFLTTTIWSFVTDFSKDLEQSDEETKEAFRRLGKVALRTAFRMVKKSDSKVGEFARKAEGVLREEFNGK